MLHLNLGDLQLGLKTVAPTQMRMKTTHQPEAKVALGATDPDHDRKQNINLFLT